MCGCVCPNIFMQAKFTEFKIQNMVGSCDVKFPIRLEGLVVQHQQFCRYAHACAHTQNYRLEGILHNHIITAVMNQSCSRV